MIPPRPGLADLSDLVALLGREVVLHRLNIHRTTLMRWESGAYRIPDRTLFLIRSLLGHLPGTDGQWQGWRFWDGKLWNPAGDCWTPNEVESRHWNLQLIDALRRRVTELEAQVKSMSVDPFVREKAANDMTDGLAKPPRVRSTYEPLPASSPMPSRRRRP